MPKIRLRPRRPAEKKVSQAPQAIEGTCKQDQLINLPGRAGSRSCAVDRTSAGNEARPSLPVSLARADTERQKALPILLHPSELLYWHLYRKDICDPDQGDAREYVRQG